MVVAENHAMVQINRFSAKKIDLVLLNAIWTTE